VKQFSDKPYSMAQYQEGWGRFLDRAGMEAGPMRDLAESFGQQMLSGNIDGKQLSGLMSQLDNLERGSAAQMLSQVNQELKDNGVSIAATVKDGKIEAMEMRAENGNVVVRVDQNGNVVATNKLVSTGESPEQISLRLAKKIEPDACP
jgi:RNA 3'-terminal phosphate cyclase